jgi:hypothetical protein
MLEGLNAAARKGHHGGRPPVITDDMLHTVLRRLASAESVELIRPDLTVPTGKRKGRNPSLAPASTGHWPSTRKRRRTSKPSNKPTPTRRAPGGHLIGPSNWITEGQRVARPYRPIFGGYYRDPKTAHRYCLELRRLGRRSLAHWPSTNATSSTPAPPRAHRWHTSCSLNSFRVRHGAACCGWSCGQPRQRGALRDDHPAIPGPRRSNISCANVDPPCVCAPGNGRWVSLSHDLRRTVHPLMAE